jgi:hypothetical protein
MACAGVGRPRYNEHEAGGDGRRPAGLAKFQTGTKTGAETSRVARASLTGDALF